MSFLASLSASTPLANLGGALRALAGATLSAGTSRALLGRLRTPVIPHFPRGALSRSGRPMGLFGVIGCGIRGAHDCRMWVAAFVIEIVLPVGDADVLAVILTRIALVDDRRHRRVIELCVENDGLGTLAHPVAELTVVGLALGVILLLLSRDAILDRVQLLKKLLLHNIGPLDALTTLGPEPFVGLAQIPLVAPNIQSFLAFLKLIQELLTRVVAVISALPN